MLQSHNERRRSQGSAFKDKSPTPPPRRPRPKVVKVPQQPPFSGINVEDVEGMEWNVNPTYEEKRSPCNENCADKKKHGEPEKEKDHCFEAKPDSEPAEQCIPNHFDKHMEDTVRDLKERLATMGEDLDNIKNAAEKLQDDLANEKEKVIETSADEDFCCHGDGEDCGSNERGFVADVTVSSTSIPIVRTGNVPGEDDETKRRHQKPTSSRPVSLCNSTSSSNLTRKKSCCSRSENFLLSPVFSALQAYIII